MFLNALCFFQVLTEAKQTVNPKLRELAQSSHGGGGYSRYGRGGGGYGGRGGGGYGGGGRRW